MRIHLAPADVRPVAGWLAFAAFWLTLCVLAAWEIVFDRSVFR